MTDVGAEQESTRGRREDRSSRRCVALLALVGAAGCAPAMTARAAGETHRIPMTDGEGGRHELFARACYPKGAGPFRVAIVNHGSPPGGASDRADMKPRSCDSEVARWFEDRGFLVVFPMRRGYGETGGRWAEDYGSCGEPDFARAGLETARDYAAVVDYATALPRARPGDVVIVGHSAGGWGTIAFDSAPHPKVTALINMAGGRGGHQHGVAGRNCRPAGLAEATARYGRSATTPMLWVYAANDTFFNPEMVGAMHAAFVGAGGVAELDQLGPFGKDGHLLFGSAGGARIWGPIVERYLATRAASAPAPSDKAASVP